MLRYSDAARELLPRFYAEYNDVTVFVEDEGDEIFYQKLLQNLFESSLRITRVFGVSGKENLFKKVIEYSEGKIIENAFFIADGDLDRMVEISAPPSDRLHVLDEYCIENYLFEEDAVCLVVQEENPSKTLEQWKERVNFLAWLENTVNVLTPLFACFVFIQKHDLGKKNIGVGIGVLISNGGHRSLDVSKVKRYVQRTKKEIQKCYDVNYEKEILKIERKMGRTWQKRKRNICGKNYLLPLLLFEIRRHCKRRLTVESVRFRLVKHCRLDTLLALRKQIEDVCMQVNRPRN